jgi:TonB family protein
MAVMRLRSSRPLIAVAAGVAILLLAERGYSQNSDGTDTPETGAVLIQLSAPKYPPLALQARIMGDVEVWLKIRPDGSVESADVVSGHPMLGQAALESAQESQFECRGCVSATPYTLTYAFSIGDGCPQVTDCSHLDIRPPEVRQSMHRIAITADPLCTCDPATRITRIKWRSAKCLYLWRCASRVTDVQ